MEPWLSPLFDADGIRAVDRWAIEEQGIPEADLMEAAGTALAEAVAGLAPQGPLRIVCGKGNNGGDGLVAARHLRGLGFELEVLELEQGRSRGSRRLAAGCRGRRRCDLRHGLQGRAEGARRCGDRSDQPLRRARGCL